MTRRMAGCVIDRCFERPHPDFVVFGYGDINKWNARGFARRSNYATAMALFERCDTAGVIGMMMGHENIREPPSSGVQGRLDRARLGRINRRSSAALRIMQEHAVVVLKA